MDLSSIHNITKAYLLINKDGITITNLHTCLKVLLRKDTVKLEIDISNKQDSIQDSMSILIIIEAILDQVRAQVQAQARVETKVQVELPRNNKEDNLEDKEDTK